MKFPIKNFFSKCDLIGSFLHIGSDLLKKSSMEKFIFRAVQLIQRNTDGTDIISCAINQEEFPSTVIF